VREDYINYLAARCQIGCGGVLKKLTGRQNWAALAKESDLKPKRQSSKQAGNDSQIGHFQETPGGAFGLSRKSVTPIGVFQNDKGVFVIGGKRPDIEEQIRRRKENSYRDMLVRLKTRPLQGMGRAPQEQAKIEMLQPLEAERKGVSDWWSNGVLEKSNSTLPFFSRS